MAWVGAAAEAGPSTAQEEEDSGLLMQDAAPVSAPASARKNLFAASNSTLSSFVDWLPLTYILLSELCPLTHSAYHCVGDDTR